MAESDLITKDDIEEIASVLQLAPHQKNTTFTTVTKGEDGDLVSLDELYEKTGQESIKTFINGFDSLVKSNKLGRAHGMALNIQGAESWMIIPDRINAVRGGEGFFGAVRDGIVAIIKAIISFISGVYNWIVTRIKALIGFGQTAKETEFLHDHSDDVKIAVYELLTGFGVQVNSDFLESIPNGITISESFTITKKRIADNKIAFNALANAAEYIKGYREKFNGWMSDVRGSKRDYDRLMTGLRNGARNKRLTIGDINDFMLGIHETNSKYTDTKKIYDYLSGLLVTLYDTEIKELGPTDSLKALKAQLEAITEQVKISYDPTYSESIKNSTVIAYKTMFKDGGGREPLKAKLIKELKEIINSKDSEFIKEIDKEYPELQLSAAYIKFGDNISEYSALLEYLLKLIQKIEISVNNMIRWKDKVDCLMSAYITGDILEILAAHDKYLTPQQRSKIENALGSRKYKINANGEKEEIMVRMPLYTDSIQNVFFKNTSSNTMLEKISEGMKIFMDTPNGKILLDNYGRFKSQMRGN